MSKNNILKLLVITALIVLTAVIFVRRYEKIKPEPGIIEVITVRGGDILNLPVFKVKSRPLGAVPVGEWDVLFIELDEIEALIPFYHKKDGVNDYEFKAEGNKIFCNGKLIFIVLENEDDWEFLEKAGEQDLTDLQFIAPDENITAARKEILKKISRVNNEIGLFLLDGGVLSGIKDVFKPKRLILLNAENFTKESIDALVQNNNLEYLGINAWELSDLSFLSKIKNLKALKISGRARAEKKILPKIKNLEALSFDLWEINSLDEIENLTHIKHLTINEEAENFHKLSKFTWIESLSFGTKGNIQKLNIVPNKEKIKRLIVSGLILQEELDFITGNFPNLEYLGVYNYNKELDGTPLKKLKKIHSLCLLSESESPETYAFLKEMKNLQLLLLNKRLFEDENYEIIVHLKAALPETIIAPAGICLGSGWLIPFCAAVLAACFFIFLTKKKNAYDSGKRK